MLDSLTGRLVRSTFLWLFLGIGQACTPTTDTAQSRSFLENASVSRVSASVSHPTLTAGETQSIQVIVRSSSDVHGAIAQIRIYDSANNRIAIKPFDSITLLAGSDT